MGHGVAVARRSTRLRGVENEITMSTTPIIKSEIIWTMVMVLN